MPPVIKPTSSGRGNLLQFALLLGVILAGLFIRSFLPDYVHFSNDGPLAVQMSHCFKLPEGFLGCWDDLNWLGFNCAIIPFEFTSAIRWAFGAVGYAKFLAPIALFIFGICAWIFLRRLKLSPVACTLGALAATLNTTFLGTCCWGVASQVIGFGMDYLALAMVVSNTAVTPRWLRWLRLVLAGFAVGIGVMEGADNGAIFSMFVAAYVLFHALMEEGSIGVKCARGVGRVIVVAVFAGLIAAQSIVGLIGTQIQGISGMDQSKESSQEHWDWATQWSTPKLEALSWVVPGLFGYRMDTPKDMPKWMQDTYRGGNYWGRMGRDLAWYRFFDGTGPQPDPNRQFIRFTGGSNYMGVLVALISLWTMAQSFRKRDSVFSITQKRYIWFWSGAILVSALLAFGRFAPFYRIVYMLPYFSTMRNPCKFTAVLNWAVAIVFAYGIDALLRRYVFVAMTNGTLSPMETLSSWWKKRAGDFDRKWLIGSVVFVAASFLGWLIYANCKTQLVTYLEVVQFGDPTLANQIASFSIRQVGIFVLFLILSITVLAFVFSGAFAGRRARWAGYCLGFVLLLDLTTSNLPYVVHWDYKEKYASNSIIDRLREKSYEQRVFALPFPTVSQMDLFSSVYRIEWAQQLFPYYDILTMDIVQMPRVPVDFSAFEGALSARDNSEMYKIARRWELTSTRYLLGAMVTQLPAPGADGQMTYQNFQTLQFLNGGLDRGKERFRIAAQFEIVPKPEVASVTEYEQLTVTEHPDPQQPWPPLLPDFPRGRYALFEFTGALPRAKLYNQWQVNTNDQEVLNTLASVDFEPHQTVIVDVPFAGGPSSTTNQSPGEVIITHYQAADITMEAQATTDSILLLNDRFDPQWKVLVDGARTKLLRCNFVMRGVALKPGKHTVEFLFRPSMKPAVVTLVTMGFAILLSGIMIYSERRMKVEPEPTTRWKDDPRGGNNAKGSRN